MRSELGKLTPQQRYHRTLRGRANSLLRGAKRRAKRRGHECTIDTQWIVDRMDVCAVTGLPFKMDIEKNYGKHNNAQPFSPTLDRIDNSKGYTPDNTQVVVAVYNFAKMHWSHDDVVQMARALL